MGFNFQIWETGKAWLCLSLVLCRKHQVLMSTWCELQVWGRMCVTEIRCRPLLVTPPELLRDTKQEGYHCSGT